MAAAVDQPKLDPADVARIAVDGIAGDAVEILVDEISRNVKAGLVYVTDVKAAGDKVKGIVIPSADNASTEYPIAVLKHGRTNPLAKAWVAYVRSAAGRTVLMQDGFAAP